MCVRSVQSYILQEYMLNKHMYVSTYVLYIYKSVIMYRTLMSILYTLNTAQLRAHYSLICRALHTNMVA
jgi:hypothetical protein